MSRPLLAVLVAFLAGCPKTSNPDVKSNTSPMADGWLVYEDNMFKAQYPPNSEVQGAKDGKQDPKFPTLSIHPGPDGAKSAIGAFVLQPDRESQSMLLRDAIQNDISRFKGDKGILIAGPRDVPVGNGRCISALLVTPTDSCAKNAGSCFAPLYLTQCDGPAGTRYNVASALAIGSSRDALSQQAQQQAATYERILRSLEFKKS